MEHRDPFVAALGGLLEHGRVVLTTPLVPAADEVVAAESVLVEFERRFRLEMPGEAPAFSVAAAMWGAEMVYLACQCLAFREIDEAELARRLARTFDGRRNASVHYSVDLTMRMLPDLYQRARSLSRNDPLVAYLLQWGEAWPLSSVGMRTTREDRPAESGRVDPECLDPILEHPSLKTLYVDRIVARNDLSRLRDPRVRELAMAAIGLHEELAPELLAGASTSNNQAEAP